MNESDSHAHFKHTANAAHNHRTRFGPSCGNSPRLFVADQLFVQLICPLLLRALLRRVAQTETKGSVDPAIISDAGRLSKRNRKRDVGLQEENFACVEGRVECGLVD